MPSPQPPSLAVGDILTQEDVAILLCVPRHSVAWLHRTKQLRGFNVARKLRFRRADVLAFIDRQLNKQASKETHHVGGTTATGR